MLVGGAVGGCLEAEGFILSFLSPLYSKWSIITRELARDAGPRAPPKPTKIPGDSNEHPFAEVLPERD